MILFDSRYLASGCSFQDLQYAYRRGISTIIGIVREVCIQIWNVMKNSFLEDLTEDKWMDVANGFKTRAQFPNCLGAIDGKHIRLFKPAKSGSSYYNYKNYFSLLLLAICDSNYKFIFVDIGAYGRNSDSTIFEDTELYRRLQSNTLNIPNPSPITTNGETVPYVFIGDEAFALSQNLMRPYSGRNIEQRKRIFNYRLSRARRYIECTFGILTSKWRIFHRPIDVSVDYAKDIVKACCILHNFVQRDGFDYEDTLTIFGLEDELGDVYRNMTPADSIRSKFADYFMSDEGSLPWQHNYI